MITAKISGIDKLDRLIQNLPQVRKAGVMVEGHAADYALIWEWGSARIHKPGPKTTWGTNPAGDRVVLTLTAPNGYIRIHHANYIQFIQEEFKAISWKSIDPADWPKAIDTMLSNAARRASQLIADGAPEDSGLLKASIHPVEPSDELLNQADDFSSISVEAA